MHQTNKKALAKRPEEHAVETPHSPVESQSTPVPTLGELGMPLGPSKPLCLTLICRTVGGCSVAINTFGSALGYL